MFKFPRRERKYWEGVTHQVEMFYKDIQDKQLEEALDRGLFLSEACSDIPRPEQAGELSTPSPEDWVDCYRGIHGHIVSDKLHSYLEEILSLIDKVKESANES